ncbi:hypothetical protein [Nocardioides dongxiaopingii]|nr:MULTISPECIES: hypothetical protein [Nocardioides]
MTAEQIGLPPTPAVPTVESTLVTALRVRRLIARLVLGDSRDGVGRREAA